MERKRYLNFDLQIDKVDDRYLVRVLDSPAGRARTDFEWPFQPLELSSFLHSVRTYRDLEIASSLTFDRYSVKDFGQRLFKAVFGGAVGSGLRSSLDQAKKEDAKLRIRLRLTDARELVNLPWEFLYDPATDSFLAQLQQSVIVRDLDVIGAATPLRVKPPLRILVMLSLPSDVSKLDGEQEWQKLTNALADLKARNLVEIDRLEKATLRELQDKLGSGEYHIFHFIGHGSFDQNKQEGVLLLEDEYKKSRRMSASRIVSLLQNHPSIRLVLLNACKGGLTAVDNPFAGVAQTLVQRGIPAVIAMQFSITDQAAIEFAHEFYDALGRGEPLESALTEGRIAIFLDDNDVEWGTPVLYMREMGEFGGYLFDIQAPPVPLTTLTTPAPTTPPPPGGLAVSSNDPWAGLAPHVRLRQMINETFSLSDLKLLCANLKIDFDELEGENKPVKVLSLIQFCQRRRRLADLINACRTYDATKAALPWPNPADIT